MSIRLDLDDSLIQVAPTLDDVEAILIVQTRRLGDGPSDGKVRKLGLQRGRKTRIALPRLNVNSDGVIYETRIGANNAKGQPDYEARTVYRAGGRGSVFLATNRRVRFTLRWYGDSNRYLELRLQVAPGAEIVANRGMSPLTPDGGFNFLGSLQGGSWAEIHYDNLTHVGLSMAIHSESLSFSKWDKPKSSPKPAKTRFDRLNESD